MSAGRCRVVVRCLFVVVAAHLAIGPKLRHRITPPAQRRPAPAAVANGRSQTTKHLPLDHQVVGADWLR
jgi:hypothetical protein